MGGALLLTGAISGAQSGALGGLEAFREMSRIAFVTGLISLPVTIIGTWKDGLRGAVIALIITQVITVFLNHALLVRIADALAVPLKVADIWREAPVLWHFSLPAVLGAAMVTPVMWACSAILVNTPNGYAEMGLFNAATQWRTVILIFPTLLAGVALPMLSSLRGKEDAGAYRRLLWLNLLLSFGSSAVIGGIIAAFAPFIMGTYGQSFVGGSQVLMVLSAVSVVSATLNVVGQAMASEGRMWAGFGLNLIWATVLVASTWMLRSFGAMGLAAANLISYTVHLITVSIYVAVKLK
jgi:O-antigen/teichoic acid export membrane protein